MVYRVLKVNFELNTISQRTKKKSNGAQKLKEARGTDVGKTRYNMALFQVQEGESAIINKDLALSENVGGNIPLRGSGME